MAVRIYLEIGHEASIRTKKTQEGFTHDWEVFVRGCDGAEIHYFVEKVVFYLHETFPKPKRVVKEPPYSVKESGYAGFNLPIDIYLRNNNEPKKIRFNYDLHLQQTGPPILKVQKEKYIFNSPTEEFKMKVLKGGGVIGNSSSSIQETSDMRSSYDEKNQMTNKPKLSGCDLIKKPKMKLGEPCRDFQELFGSPINMSSKGLEQKKPESKSEVKEKSRTKHSPHKDKSKEKTESKREEKKQKEKSKDKERNKVKSTKREKSPRPKSPSPKRPPSPHFPSPVSLPKHKESKHEKEKRDSKEERKKKEKKSKEHKEKHDEQRSEDHKDGKNRSEKKDETKKVETSPLSVKNNEKKEKSTKDKLSKESNREERHSEKYKHKKKDKEKREKKEEKLHKSEKKAEKAPEIKPNIFKSEPQFTKKEKPQFINPIINTDESSNCSISSSNSSIAEKKVEETKRKDNMKVKEEKKMKKEKGYQETIKCKRKSNSLEKEEPPEKVQKDQINNHSDGEVKTEDLAAPEGLEEDYFGLLRDLQHKIMSLKENSDLQRVVKLIAETGRYEVSAHTFDFDLCLLDRSTVQQLQDFFASET